MDHPAEELFTDYQQTVLIWCFSDFVRDRKISEVILLAVLLLLLLFGSQFATLSTVHACFVMYVYGTHLTSKRRKNKGIREQEGGQIQLPIRDQNMAPFMSLKLLLRRVVRLEIQSSKAKPVGAIN